MRINCRLMCAGLIGLSSLPNTGCSSEEDAVSNLLHSFAEQYFPSENFFNESNVIASTGQRWEIVKTIGSYGFAIVTVNNRMKLTKRTLSKLCTSALTRPFRVKLAKQVSRELAIDVKQNVLIKLSNGKFKLSNHKRKPFQKKDGFFLTGCEAEVELINSKKSKLELQYNLSKYLLEIEYYEDAAKVAKGLLKSKAFVDNATTIIATSALNLNNQGALIYTKKFVHIDLINDSEILLDFSKAAYQRDMRNMAFNATNRCLKLNPDDQNCLDFQLDILIGKIEYNQEEILDFESYFQ